MKQFGIKRKHEHNFVENDTITIKFGLFHLTGYSSDFLIMLITTFITLVKFGDFLYIFLLLWSYEAFSASLYSIV